MKRLVGKLEIVQLHSNRLKRNEVKEGLSPLKQKREKPLTVSTMDAIKENDQNWILSLRHYLIIYLVCHY